jgi:hypothetical protein
MLYGTLAFNHASHGDLAPSEAIIFMQNSRKLLHLSGTKPSLFRVMARVEMLVKAISVPMRDAFSESGASVTLSASGT